MKCKDLIKIIQDLKLEDWDIYAIDLDYMWKVGDIVVGTNQKTLPYPEYKDVFTLLKAVSYDQIYVTVDMDKGTVLSQDKNHYDTSSEEQYPY